MRLALKVSLPESLHTQSNKPLDPTLIPTVLTIDAPAGVTVDEIVYPPAVELKQQGLDQPLVVFEHEFLIGVQVTLGPGMAAGDLVLPAHLRYQACNDMMCFAPATADVRVDPSCRAGRNGDGRRRTRRLRPSRSAAARSPRAGLRDAARSPWRRGAARHQRQADSLDVVKALDGFTVLGTTGGYLGTDDFLAFIRNAETGVKERGMFEGRGPLAILLLVLIGGLALNLTPCVLPMIPINLAIIGAGAQAGSRGRGFLLGSAYGAAMALVYGLLGLVVILTAGTFGTINASPWFNLGIAVLFVVLALAMFDVIVDRLLALRQQLRARREPRHACPRLHHGRRRRAARRRLRRAGRHPGGAVLEQPLRRRARRSRWRCPSASASAWRCRGPSRAPASRRCRSPACGWCA